MVYYLKHLANEKNQKLTLPKPKSVILPEWERFAGKGLEKRRVGVGGNPSHFVKLTPRLGAQILSTPLHLLNNFPGQMSM